jgi:hypothetical protein
MNRILLVALLAAVLPGCQLFVDFDRDLLDGGDDGGGSGMRVSARVSDGGVADGDVDDADH